MKKQYEPQWLKNAAKTMLQGAKESYGDEDQNDLMEIIDSEDHDLPEGETEPEWLQKMAKGCLTQPREPYGDEDQNELMEEIRTE